MSDAILLWNRQAGREETEKVFGDVLVRLLYGTGHGRWMADNLLTRRWFSRVVGAYQSSRLSRARIAAFVREFGVPMHEYEAGPFRSFNEFFTRRFRDGARVFAAAPDVMPAFAEGRYLAWPRIESRQTFPVKGEHLGAAAILGDAGRAAPFDGGPVVIARLCPVDYHRFHFPDDGSVVAQYRVAGRLHSVNPLALRERGDVFATNERQVAILDTVHFGPLAYVEVGALCVGRIVQTHAGRDFRRGEEKGMFLFGASTVIVFGQAGRWSPDPDLLEQTARGRECLVRLGERIASATRA